MGVRRQAVTPNDLNDGEATFPEFHSVYMDPESFAHYEKTGEFRDGTVMVKELIGVGAKEATSGKGYFMGDFTRPGGVDQGLEALQGRARQLGLLQLRPQVPAQGGGGEERRRLVQRVPPDQRREGLRLQPVLPRLACSGPAFEVRSAGRVRVGPIPDTPTSPTPGDIP